MSKPFVFEKPVGFRDIVPEVVQKKNEVLHRIQNELNMWGYSQIETPTIEYYDTVGGVSSTLEQRLFKLLDRSGRSSVLRPDMTAPIARVVGSLLKDEPFPVRLSYQGNVFRAQENEAGRNAEYTEAGVELIGEGAPDADAEVISLAIASLKAVKVNDFKLAIGHIGFMDALFKDILDDAQKETELRQYLHQKNYVGYRHFVEKEALSEHQKNALLSLTQLRGGVEQIEEAKKWASSRASIQAIQELEEVWKVLEIYGVTEYVLIDLSLIYQRDYYTGILFEGYADQIGFPICNGGRYDHLLGQFGRPAPATGFALKVDRILEASQMKVQVSARHVLITYMNEQRARAISLAQEMREQGTVVALHRMTEINEEPGLVGKHFDEQIRLEQEGRE